MSFEKLQKKVLILSFASQNFGRNGEWFAPLVVRINAKLAWLHLKFPLVFQLLASILVMGSIFSQALKWLTGTPRY